jgi:hypothetical protein
MDQAERERGWIVCGDERPNGVDEELSETLNAGLKSCAATW